LSEPTSAYSYSDLVAKAANEQGIAYFAGGTGKALVPADDEYSLQICKEEVNDAIKMFIADAPRKGWRWMRRLMRVNIDTTRVTGTADAADATSLTDATLETSYASDDDLNTWWIFILTGTGIGSYAQITDYTTSGGVITVAGWLDQYGNTGGTTPAVGDTFAITKYETVGGDISRYMLPEDFGGEVNSKIEYEADTNHSAIIGWVDEAMIRRRRAVNVISGYPRLAAYRPLEPAGSTLSNTSGSRRWELILDPQPIADDVLEFLYTLYFDKLDLEAGTASGGGATTLVDSSRAEGDDYFNTWRITVIAGTGKGSNAIATDYTGSSGTFIVADWLKADGTAGGTDPDATSIYSVEPANNRHPAGFRFDEAIWAAVKYKIEEEDEEINKGFTEKYVGKALPKAYTIDGRGTPRTLGSMNWQVDYVHERIFRDVTNTNSV